jgi:hypothetical protein
MTSVVLLMSLLMACGKPEDTVEIQKQEVIEKKVVKKNPMKEYKTLIGLGNAEDVAELLKKNSFSAEQRETGNFFLAGVIGASNGDASVLQSSIDKAWSAFVAKDYARMATEAQTLDDGDLRAGLLALAALHGVESLVLAEFKQHEEAVAAESKKRKNERTVIPPKDWSNGQALELLMVLDAEKGSEFLERAKVVNSWSAKFALSSWAEKSEDPSALEFVQQAAAFEGMQQTVLSLHQAKFELDPEKAIEISKKALEAAVANGDVLAGRMAVAHLIEAYGQEGKYSQLWTESSEHM